jgi:hypothetical protein
MKTTTFTSTAQAGPGKTVILAAPPQKGGAQKPRENREPIVRGGSGRLVRGAVWIALLWGIIGGFEILGHWWPRLNTITKDQVTFMFALAVLAAEKLCAPNAESSDRP